MSIYYNFPIPTIGVGLPTGGSLQLLQLDPSESLQEQDSIINNNFRFLYEKIEKQKKNLQFLDVIKLVGSIRNKATFVSQVANLLPGESLTYQDNTGSYVYGGETYSYGDYIVRLADQSVEHIVGNAPIGFLPFLNSSNSIVTLYHYASSEPDGTYNKIVIDYTDSANPVYQGYKPGSSTPTTLSFNSNTGVFSANGSELRLVTQYEYHYATTTATMHYVSTQLQSPNYAYSYTITSDWNPGIVKLYNKDSNGNITEMCNGLTLTVTTSSGNKTWTWTLKAGLQSFGGTWYLEVK